MHHIQYTDREDTICPHSQHHCLKHTDNRQWKHYLWGAFSKYWESMGNFTFWLDFRCSSQFAERKFGLSTYLSTYLSQKVGLSRYSSRYL